jgi:hypothetical protein
MESTTSRRNFIKNTSLATLAVSSVEPDFDLAAKKPPFIHHVYFWLKNPSSTADRDQLVEGLKKLAKVPEIKQHYIGFPASTNRSVIERGYAVSWLLFFKDLDSEEVYQKHPIHLKFIADYGHLWEKVVVYDSI